MKILEITSTFAISFLITLFILIITIENPEIALYENTVEMLMRQEGVSSSLEIEEHFPILVEIKSNLDRIAELNQMIRSKTHGPAPTITEEESLQLEYYMQRIRQLRKEVKTALSQLVATYVKEQP